MENADAFAEFVRAVRERYNASVSRRRRIYKAAVGDPYGYERSRGRKAHDVFAYAVLNIAAEDVYERCALLVAVIRGVIDQGGASLSSADLARAFDEVAGTVSVNAEPCAADAPTIFADICGPVETWAHNLGPWPSEAGQGLLRSLREQETEALNEHRFAAIDLARRPAEAAIVSTTSAVAPSQVAAQPANDARYDLFISYASEDNEFVAALARALDNVGVRVWYDKFILRPGDSLSAKLHEGLSTSKFGLVILSQSFFGKNWTAAELGALIALQNGDGQRRLVPVWHGVTRDQVAKYNVFLLDVIAVQSKGDLAHVASEVLTVVRPDLQRADLTITTVTETESPAGTASIVAAAPVAAAPLQEAEYDLAPYHLGDENVPFDALPWQPYFVAQQPCLEVRFGAIQSVDFGMVRGKRWTAEFFATNVGTGTARRVSIFLPCLAVQSIDSIEPHATSNLSFICDDRDAFWNHVQPPIQALMEYEDVSGILYRQYGRMLQEKVPSGAFYRFGFSDLGKPYRVKARIINTEIPSAWIVKVPT